MEKIVKRQGLRQKRNFFLGDTHYGNDTCSKVSEWTEKKERKKKKDRMGADSMAK